MRRRTTACASALPAPSGKLIRCIYEQVFVCECLLGPVFPAGLRGGPGCWRTPFRASGTRDRIAENRRRARRERLGIGQSHRTIRPAGAPRGAACHRSHRSAGAVRQGASLHWCSRLCLAAGDRHRNAPRRRSAVRRRQFSGRTRYVPRFAERVHVSHHPARRQARTADLRRGRRRRARHDGERESQLGWCVGRSGEDHAGWLDGGDFDPRQHPSLRQARRAGVGDQLPASHSSQERNGVLGAHSQGL